MIEALRLTGRCANGAERDKGHIYHAVENGRALCGKTPGRHSAGWSWPEEGSIVTCPKCKAISLRYNEEQQAIVDDATLAKVAPQSARTAIAAF